MTVANSIGQTLGSIAKNDDGSIGTDLLSWRKFQNLLYYGINAGTFSTKDIVSTYSLAYTNGAGSFWGGNVAPNGEIHFVPYAQAVGQKLSVDGVASTYSANNNFIGGAMSPSGDIHLGPNFAGYGQKISPSGVISTYSLVYTVSAAYRGAACDPNGNIHFIPCSAAVGQKVSAAGTVSTYSLVYTAATAYHGGVLAPNGDIHFSPLTSTIGQKVSAAGTVSTYSLVGGGGNNGIVTPKGEIYFTGNSIIQKIDTAGVVSTFALAYTSGSYTGAVLGYNGEVHLVPYASAIGQKINTLTGTASTYALAYTTSNAYRGGVLAPNGDIHFVPYGAAVGQKVCTLNPYQYGIGVCVNPWLGNCA